MNSFVMGMVATRTFAETSERPCGYHLCRFGADMDGDDTAAQTVETYIAPAALFHEFPQC